MTTLPSGEQEQRAKWDLLLLDIETRSEQLRQLKTYEGRRLLIQGGTMAGTLLTAGAALMALAVHLAGRG